MDAPAPMPLLIAALEATGARAVVVDERSEVRHLTPGARSLLGFGETELPTASAIARRSEERGLKRRSEPLPGGLSLELFDDLPRKREVLEIALHDLRSPIANVRSYAGLLTRGKLTPEKLARLADVVARNADRALRLTGDYIESELAQLGALGIHKEQHRLTPLLESTIATRRRLAQERGVKIELGAHPEVTLPLDPERFSHALDAVLDRAVTRTPDGERVRVSVAALPDEVQLDIHDLGATANPSELERTRDAQICSDRRLFPAIGLDVARALLEAHGGSITLTPASPGARWRLRLPRH